jgi:hypothetical protein
LYYEPSIDFQESDGAEVLRNIDDEVSSDYISRTFPNGYPKIDPSD